MEKIFKAGKFNQKTLIRGMQTNSSRYFEFDKTFFLATAFNQVLSSWTVHPEATTQWMFSQSGCSSLAWLGLGSSLTTCA